MINLKKIKWKCKREAERVTNEEEMLQKWIISKIAHALNQPNDKGHQRRTKKWNRYVWMNTGEKKCNTYKTKSIASIVAECDFESEKKGEQRRSISTKRKLDIHVTTTHKNQATTHLLMETNQKFRWKNLLREKTSEICHKNIIPSQQKRRKGTRDKKPELLNEQSQKCATRNITKKKHWDGMKWRKKESDTKKNTTNKEKNVLE